MKHRRLIALILTLTLLLDLIPSALAAVGTGWDDDCRGNKQMDTLGNVIYGQHDWVQRSETPGSSCTSKGTAEYRCSYCGANVTRATKAPGHKWGSWQTTKEATCTKKGEETRKCKVCGKKETRETDKLPHSWGDWTVTVEATDFTMGTHTHICKACGKEKSEDFYPDPTYKKGDKGAGVKELQEKLNAAGYECGAADGDFGKKTEAAVKALEAANGFTTDGIAWPGVQKWLTPPEPESEPEIEPGPEDGPEPEKDEDEYGWDPPGDISTYSGPSLPPLPDEAAETYETTPQYDNATYTYTAYSEDVDGSGLSLGDKAQVEVTVTNTGTAPLWIGYYRFFYDVELISCDPGAKGVWYDGWGSTFYLHLPGESSKWTVEIDKEITEKNLADGYLTDIAEWRAYPLEYCVENGKTTGILPDDWPYKGVSTDEIHLRHPVFVSLGEPCLQCKVVYYPKAVRTDLGENMSCQVQLFNTGGRLLHNAEADLLLWNKDTGEYTYSKTFPLKDYVFFPKDSSIYVYTLAWGNDIYPVTLWDFENSIDGATRIAYKGRAWTLDGEIYETEITPVEFYPYYVDLWAELAETPEAQTPEGGFVKAKVRVGNDGSDTFDASSIFCPIYDPVKDVDIWDDTSEIHGGDLAWLYEGTSQEFEVWVKPTKEEIQAGEAQRDVEVSFQRWARDGGRSVYADTPKEEVMGHFDEYWLDEFDRVRVVIPLLATETESAPEATPTPAPERDACVRKIEGRGDGVAEYTLTYCAEHEQLRESTRLTLARAGDDKKEALETAIEDWREALDAEYEALLGQLGEESRPVVEAERAAFSELLEARQALLAQGRPGEDEEAGYDVLEMLVNKVAEMCDERHTAPNARADSLTNEHLAALEPVEAAWPCEVFTALIPNGERTRETLCLDHRDAERRAGELTAATPETAAEAWREVKQLWLGELNDSTSRRYIVADEAGRALIAADRQAFGAWLAAREALLSALYPDQPAVVQEVLSQAVRARVLENCGD